MGDHRSAKVGDPFYDIFTVFEFDGVSTKSGETSFAVDFVHDDTPTVVAYTIAEIGTSGDYQLTVPGGFPSVGVWAITVEVAYNGSTWRTFAEVSLHDIDEVYEIIIAGGSGVEVVTIELLNSVTSAPLIDALINVYDAAGVTLITFGRTDSSGQFEFNLDEGDYVLRFFSVGVSFDVENLTVPSGGGLFTYYGTAIVVSPPADPTLCRLYADLITMSGIAIEDFKITVTNEFDPNSDAGLRPVENYQEHFTDAAGHVEIDLVRGLNVRVAFPTTKLTRNIIVPDVPVADLLEILGIAPDAFQVVRVV